MLPVDLNRTHDRAYVAPELAPNMRSTGLDLSPKVARRIGLAVKAVVATGAYVPQSRRRMRQEKHSRTRKLYRPEPRKLATDSSRDLTARDLTAWGLAA